ncbi:MAG: PIG-L family deacetylase [Actinomycetota bacterium]|nr:PIG-L family deacetylase [Acidimicrobiia bacterium]MDQ3294528.1 PIG-L family deacetylase [Actinomycetota bacterium]
MATLVSFHAHPDDECIATAGVLVKAKEDGHRTVLVFATRGEHGEVADGFLGADEELWTRRVDETHAAAAVLGVDRVEFLGYRDSGMMGTPENDLPGSFWTADIEEAAQKLGALLREEDAEVFTCYDEIGGYGHPDHIRVHEVGLRAAALAGTPRVYQSTINRDALMRMGEGLDPEVMAEAGLEMPDFERQPQFGMPEAVITCAVDVTAYAPRKRAAMRAHASQIADDHFMLAMPDDMFAAAFGTEWFIRDGQGPGITETSIL